MASEAMKTSPTNKPQGHSINACVRCRQRKTKCDPTLPACEPCTRSGSQCEYYDSTKNKIIPRAYITSLQDTVRRLQAELKSLEQEEDYEPDHESMARAPGLVKFTENDESRFLGPSSGIAVTRFVMDFARRNASRRTIRDVVTDQAAQQIKQTNTAESIKPTSKVYPLISSVAAPNLPNRGLMEQLLNIYMVKAQYMLPLLHEPTFRHSVDLVYDGSIDATLNFQVRMVIAISMQKLDTQYAGLADSYYLAALPYLSESIQRKDLSTLQSMALMAQYSLLTPTRTAAYWVVGLAAKLCQELGICDEGAIAKPPLGTRPSFLEVDMRRRLFWIITSMEYGLSHSLGRPSAFGVGVDNINVGFFQLCDDKFITPDGLLPGHHPVMKKCIAVHFFKMRLLQAEIRRTLYLRKRESPLTDRDPWFQRMRSSIEIWTRDTPKNDEGSGLSPAWFEGRKNTMIVFMYRPSPQIPNPSPSAAELCYQAAAFNIDLQKKQVENQLIDITWIFTQAIFMALNTILWSISYAEIRSQHPVDEVQHHISNCLAAINMCADRWPGVRSAHQLYGNLISACLKAYDTQIATSPVASGSAMGASHTKTNSSTSQTAQSPVSTSATSFQGPQSPQSYSSYPSMHSSEQASVAYEQMQGATHEAEPGTFVTQSQTYKLYPATSPTDLTRPRSYVPSKFTAPTDIGYPATTQQLPSWESMASASFIPGTAAYNDLTFDEAPWLASFGADFHPMGSANEAVPHQMRSLDEKQQLDLLASLEQSRLPDMSSLVNDANTFYLP
ncbi:hypothetical protein PMZ80_001085 [Knufia obscura]|uniref:Zn(2)-C6 fungal-type domain-containing protein n=1 Tax=Knufia obscura TaxID=1635080 RepID=A0ABR0S372_9EURO|nr:hypothetical protein PMZ80_001085 [Knufia obscura]